MINKQQLIAEEVFMTVNLQPPTNFAQSQLRHKILRKHLRRPSPPPPPIDCICK